MREMVVAKIVQKWLFKYLLFWKTNYRYWKHKHKSFARTTPIWY